MPYDAKSPIHRAIDKRLAIYEQRGLTPQEARAIASGVLWAMCGEFKKDGRDAIVESITTVIRHL